MQTIWKLTALAAVIGAGLVVVIQAQRGLNIPGFPGSQAVADEVESDDIEADLGNASDLDETPPVDERHGPPSRRRARDRAALERTEEVAEWAADNAQPDPFAQPPKATKAAPRTPPRKPRPRPIQDEAVALTANSEPEFDPPPARAPKPPPARPRAAEVEENPFAAFEREAPPPQKKNAEPRPGQLPDSDDADPFTAPPGYGAEPPPLPRAEIERAKRLPRPKAQKIELAVGEKEARPQAPADSPFEAGEENDVEESLEFPADRDDAPKAERLPPPREQAPAMQKPQLTIEKIAPEKAALGEPLIYKVVIRNVGAAAAREVTVEDQIPSGAQLHGTIPQAELAGDKLTWRLGTLNPNEERLIRVRIIPTVEGQLGSVATVNFIAEVGTQTDVTATRLHLEGASPQQARVGQEVKLGFKITNVGTTTAQNVVLRDLLPETLRHPGGNDLEYTVGELAPGKSTDVELTVTAAAPGRAVNRATVTADGAKSQESQLEMQIVNGSKLAVNRTGPKHHYLNRPAIFTTTITNQGDQPMAGATIIERIPDGVDCTQASKGGTYDEKQRTVTWRFDAIAPGQSAAVRLALVPRIRGAVNGVVRVVDGEGNYADTQVALNVEGLSVLSLALADSIGPVGVGEQTQFTVRLSNRGNEVATNAVVTIRLPQELSFVQGKGPITYRHTAGEVEFGAIPRLEPGAEAQFTITAAGAAAGDGRVMLHLKSDQMQKPLIKEEPVPVLSSEE